METWLLPVSALLHLRLGSLLAYLVDSLQVRARMWVVQTLRSIPLVETRDKLREFLGSFTTKNFAIYDHQVLDA